MAQTQTPGGKRTAEHSKHVSMLVTAVREGRASEIAATHVAFVVVRSLQNSVLVASTYPVTNPWDYVNAVKVLDVARDFATAKAEDLSHYPDLADAVHEALRVAEFAREQVESVMIRKFMDANPNFIDHNDSQTHPIPT